MIFGDKTKSNDYWFEDDNYSSWDKSRCNPFGGRTENCDGNFDDYIMPVPGIPNIVSISNALSGSANVNIESQQIPITGYIIYVKRYELDTGYHIESYEFNTLELSPNIIIPRLMLDFKYKVSACAYNDSGISEVSAGYEFDTQRLKITSYPLPPLPPGDVREIDCEYGLGCEDTLICT